MAHRLAGIPIRVADRDCSGTGTARPGQPPRRRTRQHRHPRLVWVARRRPPKPPSAPPAMGSKVTANSRTQPAICTDSSPVRPSARSVSQPLRRDPQRYANYQQIQKKKSPVGWWIVGPRSSWPSWSSPCSRSVRSPAATAGSSARPAASLQDVCPAEKSETAEARPAARMTAGCMAARSRIPARLTVGPAEIRIRVPFGSDVRKPGVHRRVELPAGQPGWPRCWSANSRPGTDSSPPSRARRSW